MKKEIDLSDAIGKTLEGFDFSRTNGQMVMVFSDETFTTVCITGDPGYEEIQESELDLINFGNQKLITLGIFSEQEIYEEREKRKKEIKDKREKFERTEFERLRKKFGKTGDL